MSSFDMLGQITFVPECHGATGVSAVVRLFLSVAHNMREKLTYAHYYLVTATFVLASEQSWSFLVWCFNEFVHNELRWFWNVFGKVHLVENSALKLLSRIFLYEPIWLNFILFHEFTGKFVAASNLAFPLILIKEFGARLWLDILVCYLRTGLRQLWIVFFLIIATFFMSLTIMVNNKWIKAI